MKNWKRKSYLYRWIIANVEYEADCCVLFRGVRLCYSYGLDDLTFQGASR